ncbi:unnamed protein product [Paramecium sonneborni]|uniref:Uncharacterized protein n=1 Tax=Paramecium sonneborni TaxID=65129 RepID=A0A8S1N3S0_9CILI|nr:unnamed protein product [Paramecium sonneborni]
MSQAESGQLADSCRTAHTIKSILKISKKDKGLMETRIDSIGNKIVKGGNHKITFKPVSQSPVTKNLMKNKIQIESDSSDSECEIQQYNVNQNIKKTNEELKNKNQKPEPQISNESKCCIIF